MALPQSSPFLPQSPPSPSHIFTPLMITMAGFMGTSIALVVYHFIVSKFCIRGGGLAAANAGQPHCMGNTKTGVDEKVLESIPICAYTSKKQELLGVDQCECSVCLGELEEGDPIRILPNCHHLFHLQCIDEWFISHSNCPLCRSQIVSPASPSLSVIISVGERDSAHLLHESQSQGGTVTPVDAGAGAGVSNASRRSKGSLRHCASGFLSVERNPQLSLAQLKRSISDCSNVSITLDQSPSSPSCSSKIECSRSGSWRRGSKRQTESSSSMLIKSFSRLRLNRGGADSSSLPL